MRLMTPLSSCKVGAAVGWPSLQHSMIAQGHPLLLARPTRSEKVKHTTGWTLDASVERIKGCQPSPGIRGSPFGLGW